MSRRDREARQAKRDWEQSQRLRKLAHRHRRPISRLVATRINNAIRNGDASWAQAVY